MMHAYKELYLDDAKQNLGQCLSYLIDDCNLSPDRAWTFFRNSGYAEKFEKGDPWVISGMSGIELGEKIILRSYGMEDANETSASVKEPVKAYNQKRSPAYWAGWALAEYQWYTGRRFCDILSLVPLESIIAMYKPYHEMDISQFIEEMDRRISTICKLRETKIKTIREARGISQSELAERSGVKLRSIQMYEQRQNDIDKAQGHTLYKLARSLGCDIEDLLEDPSI